MVPIAPGRSVLLAFPTPGRVSDMPHSAVLAPIGLRRTPGRAGTSTREHVLECTAFRRVGPLPHAGSVARPGHRLVTSTGDELVSGEIDDDVDPAARLDDRIAGDDAGVRAQP